MVLSQFNLFYRGIGPFDVPEATVSYKETEFIIINLKSWQYILVTLNQKVYFFSVWPLRYAYNALISALLPNNDSFRRAIKEV